MSFLHSTRKLRLLATAAPLGFMAMIASPAFAQTAPAPAPAPTDQVAGTDDIVVTGTLFRKTETASPVTTLTADTLEKRGLSTVADAIQMLSANNAGALPNSFSANGAFAAGASAASLRGLTTSSTLVLFDGLRASYYPLADDGTRNFVDLNTIPSAIIERIEVLKDGASSTYGADAVAGVINIITKKQITGLHLRAEAGISQLGDAGAKRLEATYGYGKLNEDGFNVYVSGEYSTNDALYNRDRGYPYNTSDLSALCGVSRGTTNSAGAVVIPAGAKVCRTNGVTNGIQPNITVGGVPVPGTTVDGFALGTTLVPIVRAYNGQTTAVGRYQFLNAAAGCGNLTPVTLTATQAGTANPAVVCQEDNRNLFGTISPRLSRLGGTIRATFKIGGAAEAYAEFNYYQNKTFYTGTPRGFTGQTTAASNPVIQSTLSVLLLPQYVCAAGVGALAGTTNISTGCTAANGTLNPNNPFAASGQNARIVGLIQDVPFTGSQFSRTYRGAAGISGTFGDDWTYSLEGTAMRTNLRATSTGYINLQHLLNAVAQGTYNFVNPSLNSQAIRDYVSPAAVGNFNSQEYQIQGNVSKKLFELPGGPLQLGVGASYRDESVNAPSRNPENLTNPLDRYMGLNAFGAVGSRNVKSAYFELDAPILDMLSINASGRFDDYSTGQNNFSPKIGVKFSPIKQITFRGTYSKGFRVGSFAEVNGSPVTGFVTVDAPAAFQLAHGNTGYGAGYSLGLTTLSNPNLAPEKSTNFTGGVVLDPLSWLHVTVDYYSIEKKGGITFPNYKPALAAYFALPAGTVVPGQTFTQNGITIVAGTADTNPAGAGQNPTPAFVIAQLQNAASIKTSGLDFSADARITIFPGVKWISSADATYIIKYQKTNADGSVERYDGTLGPYQITSASGTPKWRGVWQNTLDFGSATLTVTTNYSGGYLETAEDNGGSYNDATCLSGVGTGTPATYRDNATPVVCRVKAFITVDLSASVNVADKFTLYGSVSNLLNVSAPYDSTTYGASNYNPAWANSGIIGRYFKMGAKVNF